MDQDVLKLSPYDGALEIPDMIAYSLWKKPDYVNDMEEDAFWIDLYAELLNGYDIFLSFETHVKTLPQKRWILPDRKLEYLPNTRVENMKKYLVSGKSNARWCERVVLRKEGKWEHPNQMLYLYTDAVDRTILEINYMEGEPEVWFDAYPKEGKRLNFEKLCSDPCYEPPQPALIVADQNLFFLNPEEYPVEQLVSRVRTVVEKYGKLLDLHI